MRPANVVIERTFAEALGATVGSKITVAGQPFTVAGIAVTAAIAPYPNICYSGCDITNYLYNNGIGTKNIGLIWMTEPDVTKLASAVNPVNNYVLNLKIRDPAQALAFASPRYHTGRPDSPLFNTWNDLASWYGLLVQDEQTVLVPGAVLLALLAIASVAVLVGSRLAEYTRRVGLLKAAGASPSLVAATFLAENLVLAVIAAAGGLVVGWLIAPLLTSPGAALIGTPGAPAFTPLMIVGVVAMALVVALASTLSPALRAARTSTSTRWPMLLALRSAGAASSASPVGCLCRRCSGCASSPAGHVAPCSAPPASRSRSPGSSRCSSSAPLLRSLVRDTLALSPIRLSTGTSRCSR